MTRGRWTRAAAAALALGVACALLPVLEDTKGQQASPSVAAANAPGTTVLADLYKKMRDKPYEPDLDALWRDLGVSVEGGGVTFDDSAPLAPLRRAITAAPEG